MSYRLRVTLLAIGAVLGLAGGIRHFAHIHHDRQHCGEHNAAQP